MKNKKVFCEECRKDVDFIVYDKQMTGVIKGETYEYLGKVAYCADCELEIYVDEVNDFNLSALYSEYRKRNNIISLDEILKICSMYNIGKRPLSLLLGWGEQTFSRYCDGDVPTKQYSDILKKIYEEPLFYKQILEENKNNIKTETAYKKSKMAVDQLIGKDLQGKSKIYMAIEYLLHKCEDVTPLALQKALYFAQGFHYAFYKKFLFKEDCKAWVHGPVYPDVYCRYKDYKCDPIKPAGEIENFNFKPSELAVLESIAKNLCCYSGKVLEKFTHFEGPWLLARENLKEEESSDKIISKEDLAKYFESVKEKYKMKDPSDIKLYSQKMFQKIYLSST